MSARKALLVLVVLVLGPGLVAAWMILAARSALGILAFPFGS